MHSMFTQLVATLVAISASADVAQRRIPNVLPAAVAVLGLAEAVQRGIGEMVTSVLVTIAASALLVFAWRMRWLGGGDVKLASACVLWVGPGRLASFLAAAALAGGVLSALMWARATADAQLAAAVRLEGVIRNRASAHYAPRSQVPYGLAIAIGAIYAGLR